MVSEHLNYIECHVPAWQLEAGLEKLVPSWQQCLTSFFSPFLNFAARERSKKMSMGCLNWVIVKFVLNGTSHCCPVLAFWVYHPCRLLVPRGQGLWLILVRLKISIRLPWTPETDVKYMNNWINGLPTNKEVGSLRFMGWFDLLNVFKQPAVSSKPVIGLTHVQGLEWMPVLGPGPEVCWLIVFLSRWGVKCAGDEQRDWKQYVVFYSFPPLLSWN